MENRLKLVHGEFGDSLRSFAKEFHVLIVLLREDL